jgi:hypothetical protein
MILINRRPWANDTFKKLRGSYDEDAAQIERDVKTGKKHLYQISGKGVDVWAVVKAESSGKGHQLVVCCVGGVGMKEAGNVLMKSAKKQGFESIRYHIKNAAVQRLYSMYGFAGKELERVYKINLVGG